MLLFCVEHALVKVMVSQYGPYRVVCVYLKSSVQLKRGIAMYTFVVKLFTPCGQ